MTTKFSRNRAKVQPTPKVCISEKPRPAPPPPAFPAMVHGVITWSVANMMMQPSSFTKTIDVPDSGGGIYVHNDTDGQGRAVVITIQLNTASDSTITITIAGYGPSADFTGNGQAWNGTNNQTSSTEPLVPGAGLFGSGSWLWYIP